MTRHRYRYVGHEPGAWLWRQLERHYAGEPNRLGEVELRHAGRCGRCGRELTTPDSVDTGFGPDCAAALGVPHKSLPAEGGGHAGWDPRAFLLAGGWAPLTVRSLATGAHRTVRMRWRRVGDRDRFYLDLLTGPDTWQQIGHLVEET